jgi:RNA polymerase sigma-70 factor (ECF subfamily)
MTVARRRAIDRWRRRAHYEDLLRRLPADPGGGRDEPDDRLRLIFTCCHPSLAREAQLALTLRAVLGLTTAEIARAFLSTESTIAQRIVRAKRKIVEAGIPYRMPEPGQLAERLDEVLRVLYLLFNEGYLATGGPVAFRRDLTEDAEWLTALLARLLPGQPEVVGLLALIRLHRARDRARIGAEGRLVPLQHQDRALWDRAAIDAAVALLEGASRARRPGPYQVQAAIVACHAEAPSWEETDWPQILALYDVLLRFDPSPIVALNRAIAIRYVEGPAAALEALGQLAGRLDRYHLYHATRAELLRALGRPAEARAADLRAIELTANPAERALLQERIAEA